MARKTNVKTTTAKIWKTAAYIRLSREDGDKTESESVTNQRQVISDYIVSQPDLGEYSTFIDDGATGTNFDRTGFQDMLTEIKNGNINCVVVKDLSRFGRNYTEAGTYMEQIFPMFGVRFISVLDHIDSFTRPSEMDSILIPLKNLLNDSYSRDLSLKIKSVLTSKKKRGEFIGSFAAYGYQRDPDDKSKLVIDPETAPIIRNIFEWYQSGMSKLGIVRKLNELGITCPAKYRISKYDTKMRYSKEYDQKLFGLWGHQAVDRILSNPLYCGHMAQNKRKNVSYKSKQQVPIDKEDWIIVKDTHEPIIGENLFNNVQELMLQNTRVSKNSGTVHMFAGFLICADCGRAMTRNNNKRPNGKTYPKYRCSTYARHSKDECTQHTVSADELEEIVLAAIKAQMVGVVELDEMMRKYDPSGLQKANIATIDRQIMGTQKKLDDVESFKLELYSDLKRKLISDDDYVSLRNGYARQSDELKTVLSNLLIERSELENAQNNKNQLVQTIRAHSEVDKLSRELLIALVEKIYVHEDKRMEIVFKFASELKALEEYVAECCKQAV